MGGQGGQASLITPLASPTPAPLSLGKLFANLSCCRNICFPNGKPCVPRHSCLYDTGRQKPLDFPYAGRKYFARKGNMATMGEREKTHCRARTLQAADARGLLHKHILCPASARRDRNPCVPQRSFSSTEPDPQHPVPWESLARPRVTPQSPEIPASGPTASTAIEASEEGAWENSSQVFSTRKKKVKDL